MISKHMFFVFIVSLAHWERRLSLEIAEASSNCIKCSGWKKIRSSKEEKVFQEACLVVEFFLLSCNAQ